VTTTEAKAEAVSPMVERLVSNALKGELTARRSALSVLFDPNAVRKLFEDLPGLFGQGFRFDLIFYPPIAVLIVDTMHTVASKID